MNPSILVIGIGNSYRGDDGVGPIIASYLKEKLPVGTMVVERCGDGLDMMDVWKNAKTVFLIDAVCSGSQAGTVHRFDAVAGPIPTIFSRFSTHVLGIPDAVELARSLNRLPQRLVVYGVEGKNFEAGTRLSPEIESKVQDIADSILKEISTVSLDLTIT